MTTAFSLTVELPANANEDSTKQLSDAIRSAEPSAKGVPVVSCESFRLSINSTLLNGTAAAASAADESSSVCLGAVFCPTALVESSFEQLRIQSDNNNLDTPASIRWMGDPTKVSSVFLSLVHPFLEKNFTVKAVCSTQGTMQQHAPSDIILIDLSHTPRAAIFDLMESISCQVIHSGPEAVLKVLLLSSVSFSRQDPERSSRTITMENKKPNATIDIPTCPVCLHRIDPLRLGHPRPKTHQLCSRFCPPPDLHATAGRNSSISCPRQRLLRPWQPPNHCVACTIIRNYWLSEDKFETGQLFCAYCGMQETLWVCLTCGFVGCGRYSNKHAAQHNDETGHPFCLELSTLRIWSYVGGEQFAHRLDLLECPSSPPLLLPWVARASDSAFMSSEVASMALPRTSATGLASSGQRNDNGNSRHATTKLLEDNADYERMIAANFASVDDKSPKKATMIGEEYEALLQSALEEQAQHYEGEITRLRATLAAEQVDQQSMTAVEAEEIECLQKEIAQLREEIDVAAKQLLDSQAQEAGHRATSQRLLREQRVTQDLLKKIREEAAAEHEQGRTDIEELEQQIADLTANQKMMQEFSQNKDLQNSQIFGTDQSPPRSNKKGKKSRNFFRR